jgi:hypothetical protein
MKKILSLVLALVMVLGMIPAVFALEEGAASTPDYQKALDFLATVGLYKGGVPADEDVTRWQMALFVSRFITGELDDKYWEYTDEDKDSGFTDIGKLEAYQIGAVTFASQKGIVVGVGENKFAPNDNVQYRDAITMIVRALGYTMKASQYPWGYISKATELGIIGDKALVKISDVAYTDAISREVAAALLYNAFFANVDGKTVAEATFGLGTDVVMITATQDAFYNYNDKRVTKTGYVEYASIDEQGEPIGQRFYNPLAQFGFANKDEATAAIGNYYYVTYLDGKHEIIDAQSLAETYMNFGDEAQEVTNLFSGNLKIGNKSFKIVTKYTDLNYNQGYATTANEIKYFTDNGSSRYSGAEYYIGSDNNIYHVANPSTPIYIYSAITNKYYAQKYNYVNTNVGVTQQSGSYLSYEEVPAATINTILASASVGARYIGFTQQGAGILPGKKTDATSWMNYQQISAYTKAVTNGLGYDNVPDRVTVRNYEFGILRIYTGLTRYQYKSTATQGSQIYWNITTTADAAPYSNTLQRLVMDDHTAAGNKNGSTYAGPIKNTDDPNAFGFNYNTPNGTPLNGWKDQINVTGGIVTKDELKNGDGIIFYWNQYTHELEIIKVVKAQTGYVRSFSVGDNTILIGDTTYKFGYDNLYRSPLGTADQNGTAVANRQLAQAKNLAIINQFTNRYVSYYMVDGKIVYIAGAGNTNDYIIIDSIVDFSTSGIKVMAHTTVTDTLEEITIEKFNGWNIGGSFDMYIYSLMLALGQTGNINLPIETGVLYQVVNVDSATKYYNITNVGNGTTPAFNVSVNSYGYIVGLNGSNGYNATYAVATDASDYWLILVPATAATANTAATPARVYTVNGKINAVTFTAGTAAFYKSTAHDYVLITTNPADLAAVNASIENNVSYAAYDRNSMQLGNTGMFTGYTLDHTFTDLLTGSILNVTYQENMQTNFFTSSSPYYTTWYQPAVSLGAAANLIDGQIYKIVDGKLLQENTTPVTLATAVNYYLTSGKYVAMNGTTTAPTTVTFTYGQNDAQFNKPMNSAANIRKAFGKYFGSYKYSGAMDSTDLYYKDGVAKLRLYNGVNDGAVGAGYTDTPSVIALNTTSDIDYRYVYNPATGASTKVNYFTNGLSYTAYLIFNKTADEVIAFIDITGGSTSTAPVAANTVTATTGAGAFSVTPTATKTTTTVAATSATTMTVVIDCSGANGVSGATNANTTATIDGNAATVTTDGTTFTVTGNVGTVVVVTVTRASDTVTITCNF